MEPDTAMLTLGSPEKDILAQPASGISAVLQARCPRCRRGPMFKHGAFNYLHFTQMYEECPACGLHYEVEPGFFQGAMYVGYGFSVATVITSFVAVYVLFGNPDAWVYTVFCIGLTLLIFPLNFRYSRVLMLKWFGGVRVN